MRRDGAAEDADADDAVIDKSCFAYCCPYKDKYTAIADQHVDENQAGCCRRMYDGGWAICSEFTTAQELAMQYVSSELRRSRRSYCIGIFTVFLVVAFVSLISNSVRNAPFIFIRLSEITAGENDVIMIPGAGVNQKVVELPSTAGLPLLNYSFIQSQVDGFASVPSNPLHGVANRWVFPSKALLPSSAQSQNYETVLALSIDTAREAGIGLGRAWHRPPLGIGECYITRSVARNLATTPGRPDSGSNVNAIRLQIDALSVLSTVGAQGTFNGSAATSESAIQAEVFTIAKLISPGINTTALWNEPLSTVLNNLPANATAFLTGNNSTAIALSAVLSPLISSSTLIPANYSQPNVTLTNLDQTVRSALSQGFLITNPVTGATTTVNVTVPSLVFSYLNAVGPITVEVTPAPLPGVGVVLNPTSLNQALTQALSPATLAAAATNATVGQLLVALYPAMRQALILSISLSVKDIVDSPDGKWAEAIGSTVVVEEVSFLNETKRMVLQLLTQPLDLSALLSLSGAASAGSLPALPGLPSGSATVLPGLQITLADALVLAGLPRQQVTDGLQTIVTAVSMFDASSLSLQTVAQFDNRIESYFKTGDDLDLDMISWTNALARAIGIDYRSTFIMPLYTAMRGTVFIRYFLDNIFGAVIFLLITLGVLLIYSLMINDVETKTYEYGMLRALGMKMSNLVLILLNKSVIFSVLGISTGLLMCFLFNIPIAYVISSFVVLPPNFMLASGPVLMAFFVGIIMPVVANVVPISRALGKTLRNSLDVYHHVVSDVSVNVIKLAEVGVDLWQTAMAVIMVIIGFVTFYLVPYSFVFRNFTLFLGILNAILMGMLMGLCIVAQVFHPYIERGVLWLMTRPYHRQLYPICVKNQTAHNSRNSKTAQMFTISLAFIIFAGTMFALQGKSIGDNTKNFLGANIVVQSTSSEPLDELNMRGFLEKAQGDFNNKKGNSILESFTFITYDMAKLPGITAYLANILDQADLKVPLIGIQPSFYNSVYKEYYIETENPDKDKGTGVELMFTDAGNMRLPVENSYSDVLPTISSGNETLTTVLSRVGPYRRNITANWQAAVNTSYKKYIDVVISEGLRNVLGVNTRAPLMLRVNGNSYLLKARGMAAHVPGFFFSSYSTLSRLAPVLIPETAYSDILTALTKGTYKTIPMQRLLIRTSPGSTANERADLLSQLRVYLNPDKTRTSDVTSILESLSFAVEMLNLLFTVIGVVVLVLCFFILWISFTVNVTEHAWEFGVLRAIGISKVQVAMVYIYEALALVFTCLLLGTFTGVIISVTLTLQFNLFLEMPFSMEFPVGLFLTMFFLSILTAILASFLPAYSFNQKTITNILRKT